MQIIGLNTKANNFQMIFLVVKLEFNNKFNINTILMTFGQGRS